MRRHEKELVTHDRKEKLRGLFVYQAIQLLPFSELRPLCTVFIHDRFKRKFPLRPIHLFSSSTTLAVLSTAGLMLTLLPGSSCDVCAEEYGLQRQPHSIPCGESFLFSFGGEKKMF